MFKDARGINDPRRVSNIYTYPVTYNYFCSTFLPEWEYCESEEEVDWVYDMIIGEMFDYINNKMEDITDLQLYWVEEQHPCMSRLCWRLPGYSERGEWKEVYYNTSSMFAASLCDLGNDDDDFE